MSHKQHSAGAQPPGELLARAVRGEAVVWPAAEHSEALGDLMDEIAYHGVQGLLARGLDFTASPGTQTHPLAVALGDARRRLAVEQLLAERELRRVLAALAAGGVQALLIKGAALAHTHYPSPATRPRADADLLVRGHERESTLATLARLGYQRRHAISGKYLSYQCTAEKRDRFGVEHLVDVHWRISNRQHFANVLTHAELLEHSTPVPALGRHALAPCAVHALLIACMHRVAHRWAHYAMDEQRRFGGDRLVWLYDIHLLAESLDRGAFERFAGIARTRKLCNVCRDGLASAAHAFGTRVPDEILDQLRAARRDEPSAAYLEGGRFALMIAEIGGLEGWRRKLRLLCEHLFPPADYLLKRYGITNRALLPGLYLYRGAAGLWRLLRVK